MFKVHSLKCKKAQHIVELALFAPFIIIFIGIVTDIAFSIRSNYKFNTSFYEAASVIAPLHKINTSKEQTTTDIKDYTKLFAKNRYTPYWQTIDISLIETGDIDFLIGVYDYKSAFTILNSICEFTPDIYHFSSIIPLNSAVLRENIYNIENDTLNSLMNAFYLTTEEET